MAAIPAGGSLVATHDYYRRRLGSASGSSACGGADCAGGAAPQRPGESRRRHPAAEPGPWWAGLFGRPALASTAPALESPGRPQPSQASGGAGTGDSALEAVRKQPGRQPGPADPGPPS